MRVLNILPPTIGVRSIDYVPNIIQFIKRIMENGLAYESSSSVYFDTVEFQKQHPCKLTNFEFNGMDDFTVLCQEESSATSSNIDKEKRKYDFVLWQKQKSNELVWPSPWGHGRPGPHSECSVIRSIALGRNLFFV